MGKAWQALSLILFLSACAKEKLPETPSSLNSLAQLSSAHSSSGDCSLQFDHSQLCVVYAFEKLPTETDMGTLTFKTFRLNALDQTPVQVDLPSIPRVVLWMPAMGHGSSPTTVDRVDTGTYRVNDVFFIMPGEWQIRFQVLAGTAVSDEALVSFTF